MKSENELLALFQVEELEKRYEMGWRRQTETTDCLEENTEPIDMNKGSFD